MCVVSMIGDHYNKKFETFRNYEWPSTFPLTSEHVFRSEFDALKKDVQEMKELLKKAVKYDKEHSQPNCENDEKIALLKKIAALVGVSLDDVFKEVK